MSIAWKTLTVLATLTALPVCSVQSLAADAPMFVGLGDLPGGEFSSMALNISADGKIAAGYSASALGTEAFRWESGVMRPLGDLPDGPFCSIAQAVSADGSVIAGSGTTTQGTQAIRIVGDAITGLGDLPGGMYYSEARGISADGSIVVGQGKSPAGDEAFVWKSGTMSALGKLPNGNLASRAQAVSADGSVIVGTATSPDGSEAFVWADGKLTGLGHFEGGTMFSEARGVSADGAVVVGLSDSPWGQQAFRWKAGQLLGLGSLSDHHDFLSYACDASADGSIIVGTSENERGSTEAFIWDSANGMRNLREVLSAEFGLDLTGWMLSEATGISDDGSTIVGYGVNPRGQTEGWLAHLSRAEDSATAPASNDQAAFGLGSFRATLSQLREPMGAAIADDGAIFVADTGDDCIRIFDRQGGLKQTIQSIGSNTPNLSAPCGIAIGTDHHLFVTDSGHDRIVILSSAGQLVGEFGGFGAGPGQLNHPRGLALDGDRLLVADTGNNRVCIFDRNGRLLQHFGSAGDNAGQLREPVGIAIDSQHNIYVAEQGNHRIQKFNPSGKSLLMFGERGAFASLLIAPMGLAIHDDLIYVADSGNHRIQVFDQTGGLRCAWGLRVMQPHEAGGRLHFPAAIALSPLGDFAVVCEPREDRCQIFDRISAGAARCNASAPRPPRYYFGPALDVQNNIAAIVQPDRPAVDLIDLSADPPKTLVTIGEYGTKFGQFIDPAGVVLDLEHSRLIVADSGNRRLAIYELTRSVPETGRPVMVARLAKSIDCQSLRPSATSVDGIGAAAGGTMGGAVDFVPGRLKLDRDGNLFVVDSSSRILWMLDSHFKVVRTLGGPALASDARLHQPVDVAVSRSGEIVYIVDAQARCVRAFDREGKVLFSIGKPGEGPGEFVRPAGIAAGKDGFVYVTDAGADRVEQFDEQGRFIMQSGRRGMAAGEFFKPQGIAQDDQLRLIVMDWGNHRAQLFSPLDKCTGVFGESLYVRPAKNPRNELRK